MRDNPDNYTVDVDIDKFRVWAVIDSAKQRTARTGGSPQAARNAPANACSHRREMWHETQRGFCNGYAKSHGLKALTVDLVPNGLMLAAVYVCSLAGNDFGAPNMGSLEKYLADLLDPIDETGMLPTVLSDAISKRTAAQSSVLMTRLEFESDDSAVVADDYKRSIKNKRLDSCCHQYMELLYAKLFKKFTLLSRPYPNRLMLDGDLSKQAFIVSFLLMNCHTCLCGSTAGAGIMLPPPSLEEYLSLSIDYSEMETRAFTNPSATTTRIIWLLLVSMQQSERAVQFSH